MLKHFLFLLLSISLSYSFGQAEADTATTYDVVVLKDGGIIKGQIVKFSEKDGDLKIIDKKGRTYYLKSKDYQYFEENLPVKKKKKEREQDLEPIIIKERKENQFQISAGLGITIHGIKSISSSTIELNPRDYSSIVGQFSIGKYFSRHHFLGAAIEMPLSSSVSFINPKIKYQYQFDKMKNNIAHSIPVSVDYLNFKSPTNGFPFTDNTVFQQEPTNYTATVNSIGLSIGYGVQFVLDNTRSIGIELLVHRYSSIGASYTNLVTPLPDDIKYNTTGMRLGVMFNY